MGPAPSRVIQQTRLQKHIFGKTVDDFLAEVFNANEL